MNLIPDRNKKHEILRSMETIRVSALSRQRREDEFPELFSINSTSTKYQNRKESIREEEDMVVVKNKKSPSEITKEKRMESDWALLAHVSSISRRLLVSLRRALLLNSSSRSRRARMRQIDEAKRETLPKWTCGIAKVVNSKKDDVLKWIPPIHSGFSEDGASDWQTVLDLYVEVYILFLFHLFFSPILLVLHPLHTHKKKIIDTLRFKETTVCGTMRHVTSNRRRKSWNISQSGFEDRCKI